VEPAKPDPSMARAAAAAATRNELMAPLTTRGGLSRESHCGEGSDEPNGGRVQEAFSMFRST